MPISSYYGPDPACEQGRAYLESLIRDDFERCHPGDTLEDPKREAPCFLFTRGQGTAAGLDGNSRQIRSS
jgi:hypothetical protein